MSEINSAWQCVEVYPTLNSERWKPEYASAWALNDLQAAVIAKTIRETQYQGLRDADPYVEARRHFAALFRDFSDLLSSAEKEEELQKFLKSNPHLLSPSHTHCWPKLKLGPGPTGTDFVFCEPPRDYLLVEIERANLKLFRGDGQQTEALTEAQRQILGWKRYIEDNLSNVQRELGLDGISSNPRSLIVMGRSAQLTVENRRIPHTMENQNPKLRIVTYDDVLDHARAVAQNYLGPIIETDCSTSLYFLAT